MPQEQWEDNCKICKKSFKKSQRTQKYCSQPCSYKAIDLKLKKRKQGCKMVRCIACNGKGKVKRTVRSVLSEEQKKKILNLYRQGYGIREIQRQLTIPHPYSVSYYIKTCNQ